MPRSSPLISIVIPVYNEQAGISVFHDSLRRKLKELPYTFEIVYCDDGSTDATLAKLHTLSRKNHTMRVVRLSRNFGKELATTAGISEARGDAVITIDGDGQHPVELLPKFIEKWESGSKVVIGVRTANRQAGLVKQLGSKLFYFILKRLTHLEVVPDATDFRLIDKAVRADFVQMTEHNRITRGLIDWMGYERSYITFRAKPRLHDKAGYSFGRLAKLAMDSIISLSSSPLYVTAYIGMVILPLSLMLGLVMVIDKLAGDPLRWHATGSAYVTVLILCLIGILMMSQGIIGLYLSHIHSETQNRPLYIVDHEASVRL